MARGVGLGVTGVALLTLLAACDLRDIGEAMGGFGWPRGITEQSERMYELWIASVLAALAVGFLVWGLIFWCVIRYRKRSEELPPQTRFNLPMEVLYTVLPFLVVAVLFYYTAVDRDRGRQDLAEPGHHGRGRSRSSGTGSSTTATRGPEADTIASTTGDPDYVPVLVVPDRPDGPVHRAHRPRT